MLDRFSMSAVAEKLHRIGGDGKMAEREWRIRKRLNWHTKAKSAVRHLLHGERKPTLEEAKQIDAAHLKWCAEQVEANRANNAELFLSMRAALDAMERTDPDFYGPYISEVRDLLFPPRTLVREPGSED